MLAPQDTIRLFQLPIRERLEKINYYTNDFIVYEREGVAPVGTHQLYKSTLSDASHEVLMFGSNNYLNMNNHPKVVEAIGNAVKKYGNGSGGSPGFSGYTSNHRNLEKRLASLSGHDAALLLPSGYMANLCWTIGLLGKKDVLLCDKNSHASVIDGLKMSRAKIIFFDPDNITLFEDIIREQISKGVPAENILVTFEAVRSANGIIAQVKNLVEICKRYNLFTILDDAHGFGVLGTRGYGTMEHFSITSGIDIRMATCSKALGAQGAFIAGSKSAIEFLRKTSTPYSFTSGLSQASIAAISSALDVLESDPERLLKLKKNIIYLTKELVNRKFETIDNDSGIVPLFLNDHPEVSKICSRLHEKGLFVNLMEYPIIPKNANRYLRFSLMSDHTYYDIDKALDIVSDELANRIFI